MQSSLSGSSVVEKNLDRFTLFVGAIWLIAIVGTGLFVKLGVLRHAYGHVWWQRDPRHPGGGRPDGRVRAR